jgi:hypothetical protein
MKHWPKPTSAADRIRFYRFVAIVGAFSLLMRAIQDERWASVVLGSFVFVVLVVFAYKDRRDRLNAAVFKGRFETAQRRPPIVLDGLVDLQGDPGRTSKGDVS